MIDFLLKKFLYNNSVNLREYAFCIKMSLAAAFVKQSFNKYSTFPRNL